MDNRLKYIMENYDDMTIGIDDAFQFGCKQCGKCCINREDILLNPKDLYNIAKELGLTPHEVVKTYCETYIRQSSRLPIVRLKPRGTIKRCPLLKNRKCSVHRAKPTVCAMYPIGRCIKMKADEYEKNGFANVQIEYIFNQTDCGDKSETHTVREWLDSFGIPVQDESFLLWQRTISFVGRKIHEIEPSYTEDSMDVVWSLIFSVLYLSYDMSKDFFEQFKVNSEKIVDALEHLPANNEVHEND